MSDRSVIIRKFENQIASYSDYLSETSETKLCIGNTSLQKKAKKLYLKWNMKNTLILIKNLNGVTFDQIHDFLKDTKPENRIDNLKKFLKFNNISYETELWN